MHALRWHEPSCLIESPLRQSMTFRCPHRATLVLSSSDRSTSLLQRRGRSTSECSVSPRLLWLSDALAWLRLSHLRAATPRRPHMPPTGRRTCPMRDRPVSAYERRGICLGDLATTAYGRRAFLSDGLRRMSGHNALPVLWRARTRIKRAGRPATWDCPVRKASPPGSSGTTQGARPAWDHQPGSRSARGKAAIRRADRHCACGFGAVSRRGVTRPPR